MKVTNTLFADVKILEPKIFQDERGLFFESYNQRAFQDALGIAPQFVQDNHSYSKKHVLRGLHYQFPHPQAKLVRVLAGEVYDVIVDLRRSSPTFGRWAGFTLTAANHQQLWVPEGFAHGFLALTDGAELHYKTTDFYLPEAEHCLIWNDPDLAINWPIDQIPVLSQKDRQGQLFKDILTFN